METTKLCLPGVKGREGEIGQVYRILRKVKLFCISLQWILHIYQNPQNVRPRVNSNINSEFCVVMMCQCVQ